MSFNAPKYQIPIVDDRTGRISLEWYKFLVPLGRDAVPNTRIINTTAPIAGGGDLSANLTITLNAHGVTNAYLAQMATHTIKGNSTGSTADASDLTGTAVTALLDAFTSSLQGLVPASGGGTANVLRADGSWTDTVTGKIVAGTYVKTGAVLVANLPNAATAGAGSRYMVTDANATTFNSVVAGSGANTVPVFSDGSAWRIG